MKKIILMLLMIVLVSSMALAVNPCKGKIDEMNKALASSQLVTTKVVGSTTWYITKNGKAEFDPKDLTTPQGKSDSRHSEAVKKMVPFDAVIPLADGELQLYKAYGKRCVNMGYITGKIYRTPIFYTSYYITRRKISSRKYVDPTFRRIRSNREITLSPIDSKKSIILRWIRPQNQFYLYQSQASVIVATSKYGNLLNDLSNLPSSENYFKISCSKKVKRRKRTKTVNKKVVWTIWNGYDSFGISGSCKITKETHETLNPTLSRTKLKKAQKSRDEDFDMDLYTSKYRTFAFYPFRKDTWRPNRLYKVKFWGSPRNLIIDGVKMLKYTKNPTMLVLKQGYKDDGLRFMSTSYKSGNRKNKLRVQVTDWMKSKKIIFTTTDLYNSPQRYNNPLYVFNKKGQFFLSAANVKNSIKIYKTEDAQSTKDCNYHAQPKGMGREAAACYFLDKEKLFLPSSESNYEYNFNLFGKRDQHFNVIYRELIEPTRGAVDLDRLKNKVVSIFTLDNKRQKRWNRIWIISAQKVMPARMVYPKKWVAGFIEKVKFTTLVFDKKTQKIRQLYCDSATGKCFVNGVQVSEPRNYVNCRSNSDCSSGQTCINSVCANKAVGCKKYGTSSGNYDVHVYGFDMTEPEIKGFLDKALKQFFTVAPFNNRVYSQKFNIKYRPVGAMSSSVQSLLKGGKTSRDTRKAFNALKAQIGSDKCSGSPDLTVFVSTLFFSLGSSHAMGGVALSGEFLISSTTDPTNVGYIFAHELGHSLGGLVDEYYDFNDRATPQSGINCQSSRSRADNLWKALGFRGLAQQAKTNDWTGCGGACKRGTCENYLKPSEDSLMESDYSKLKGKVFNDVSKKVMELGLAKY